MTDSASIVQRIVEVNAQIQDAKGQAIRARVSGDRDNYLRHAYRLADLRAVRVALRFEKMRIDQQ